MLKGLFDVADVWYFPRAFQQVSSGCFHESQIKMSTHFHNGNYFLRWGQVLILAAGM